MNKNNRLAISLICGIVVLACVWPAIGLPGAEPTTTVPDLPDIPTSEPELPTEVPLDIPPAGNVLFTDDFSSESNELETFSDESGSAGTKDGIYSVTSTGDLWNWGRSDSEFSDTVIEFDATFITVPSNNNAGAGVICRLSAREDDSIDGYLLAISGDGYYSIRSITSSSMNPLVDWTYSDAINQGSASNLIRATCDGSELKLEVNGELVATASATSTGSSSGAMAFAAISFETGEPNSEVHFDNLVISEP